MRTRLHFEPGVHVKTSLASLLLLAGCEPKNIRYPGPADTDASAAVETDTDTDADADADADTGATTDTEYTDGDAAADTGSSAAQEFVLIPGGTFTMGCTAGQSDCEADEVEHVVTLTHDYWMGATEVTQGQFEALMAYNASSRPDCGRSCPVDGPSWHEAAAYANSKSSREGLPFCYSCVGSGSSVECTVSVSPYECTGYRLPTEAEWEAAARCGTDLLYAGSDILDEVAWTPTNGGTDCGAPVAVSACPVAGLAPNACGTYDMSGNVWEWTQDGTETWSGDAVTDPTGDPSNACLSIRGGSYAYLGASARVASRACATAHPDFGPIGFRLVRTVP